MLSTTCRTCKGTGIELIPDIVTEDNSIVNELLNKIIIGLPEHFNHEEIDEDLREYIKSFKKLT